MPSTFPSMSARARGRWVNLCVARGDAGYVDAKLAEGMLYVASWRTHNLSDRITVRSGGIAMKRQWWIAVLALGISATGLAQNPGPERLDSVEIRSEKVDGG